MENSDFPEAWPTVVIEPTLEAWRVAAKGLLARSIPPERVLWQEVGETQESLFAAAGGAVAETARVAEEPAEQPLFVPREFFDLVHSVAAHTDPQRWGVLYGLLWRLTHGERAVLAKATDPAVRQAQAWAKVVHREIHKMHAFVRFRAVREADGAEHFVAWFEPTYRTLPLAAPFFVKRFASMQWSILTPLECAHWNGRECLFTPGVRREMAPADDALDDLWRTYYRHIFNPARLKIQAMQTEMPRKYWKNLPEAEEITALIRGSTAQVEKMLATPPKPPKLRRNSEAATTMTPAANLENEPGESAPKGR